MAVDRQARLFGQVRTQYQARAVAAAEALLADGGWRAPVMLKKPPEGQPTHWASRSLLRWFAVAI